MLEAPFNIMPSNTTTKCNYKISTKLNTLSKMVFITWLLYYIFFLITQYPFMQYLMHQLFAIYCNIVGVHITNLNCYSIIAGIKGKWTCGIYIAPF